MKFLIIGASGFIGKHTLNYAKGAGYEVIGTQSSAKQPGLVTFNLLEHQIKDCVDESFFKKDKPVFGIVCSAISKIDLCLKDKKLSHAVNVEKTIQLLKDLDDLGVKIVFLSSSAVFDGKKGYYDEQDEPNPLCEYGRQKLAVEKFILKNFPDALILRLDKIIGNEPLEQHLLTEWYDLIEQKKPVNCMMGKIISPTLVQDVAKAIVLGCKKKLSGLYHASNSEFFSLEELARQFMFAFNKETKVILKPEKEFNFLDRRALKSYLDSTRFIRATDMKFTTMREVFNTFINKICSPR